MLEKPLECNVLPYSVRLMRDGVGLVLGQSKQLLNYALENYAHSFLTFHMFLSATISNQFGRG